MTPNSGPKSDESAPHDPTLLLSEAQARGLARDHMPTIDDFDLIGELGRGGMGIVYKAVRRDDKETVAIKVIRKDRLQHDESVRRFRREAQAAARLNHPNIVRVFDSDHTGDTHYLVMEYVAGVTLERLVEQHGAVDFKIAVSYLRQAALALAHAHEQGLVHRDIKPSNIMVVQPSAGIVPDGNALVKVLDMGVARLIHSEHHPGEALSTLTQGGSVIGTADFVAPEQLEDPHGADVRADLYSLGCTFYFVTVGEVPFPGGSLISKLDKQRWQVPQLVSNLRPQIAPAVAGVIAKLLEKKPAERYQSPHELIAALDELVLSNYESSVPAGPAPRETRAFAGHSGALSCVTATRKLAASSAKDQTICLWNIEVGETIRVIARQSQEVRALAFSPDGSQLAAAIGVSIRIFDPANGQEIRRLSGHSSAVRALAISDDARWLFSGGDDKTVRVWDLSHGREVQRFTRHSAAVTCLAAPPGDDVVYSGSRDQTWRCWDLRSGQESQVWSANGGPVLAIALSSDGRAATAHFDTTIRIWNLDQAVAIGELNGHKQMVTGVGFLPDGRTLVSSSQDQTVRWWDLASGAEIAAIEMGAGIVALTVVPESRNALAAGADGSLRLIEVP